MIYRARQKRAKLMPFYQSYGCEQEMAQLGALINPNTTNDLDIK